MADKKKKDAKKKPDTKNKRTPAQVIEDRTEAEILYLRGNTQAQIAKIISAKRPYSLTREQIKFDLAQIKGIWKISSKIDIDEEKGKLKAHYEYLIAQAYEMLERSRQDKKVTTTNATIIGGTIKDGVMTEGTIRERQVSERTEKQPGDARVLAEIRALLAEYKALFGLDAPKRNDSGYSLEIPWDELSPEQMMRLGQGVDPAIIKREVDERKSAA